MIKICQVKLLAVFGTIMLSGSLYFTRDKMPVGTVLYAVILLGLCFFNGVNINRKNFLVFIITWIAIFLNIFLNWNAPINVNDFVIYAVKMSAILFMACMMTKEEYIEYFVNTMCFISVYSIILYVCCVVFNRGLGLPFQQMYFINPERAGGIMRNRGPFWEPGVFQVYINMALMMLLYTNKKAEWQKLKIAILVVALLSTFSTTGYVVFLIIMIGSLFLGKENAIDGRIIFGAVLAFAVLFYIEFHFGIIESKLILGEGSYVDRQYDLQRAFINVQDNAIVGIGLFNANREGYTTFNGFLSVMISLGIPMGSIYFVKITLGWIKLLDTYSFVTKLIAATVLVVMLSSEAIAVFPAIMIFLFDFKKGEIRCADSESAWRIRQPDV